MVTKLHRSFDVGGKKAALPAAGLFTVKGWGGGGCGCGQAGPPFPAPVSQGPQRQ